MSTIDKRIVEMEFDNKQFEKGVSTTMGTLDKLDKKLRLSDGTKGLDGISKAANSINLSGIESGIEALNKRFSALGIVGMTIIKNLTEAALQMGKNLWNNTVGQIVEGGRSRAQNLQQAKFLLKGLGISWEEAYKSINESVDGTAYSLDKAAMSCASLSASGVQLGDDMTVALGAISGLAAISGDSYDHIAEIFKSAASIGHVTAQDLNRIQGVNIYQDLANELGLTVEELKKKISQGSVDFMSFADVVYSKYFEVAKGANELTSGAIDNFKSALSRIGEGFQTPWLVFIRDAANAIRPLINDIKTGLAPAFKFWAAILERLSGYLTEVTSYLHEFKPFQGYVQAFGNLFKIAYFFIVPVASAIREMFGQEPLTGVKTFGEYLALVTDKLGDFLQSSEGYEKIKNTTKTVVKVLKEFYDKVLVPVGKVLGGIALVLFKIIQLIVNLAVYLYHITPPLDEIKNSFFALIDRIQNSKAFQLLSTIFNNLVAAAKDLWVQIKDLAVQFYNLSSVQRIIKNFGDAFEWVKTKATEAWEFLKNKFWSTLESLAGTDFTMDLSGIDLTDFDEGLNSILDKIGEFKQSIIDKFNEIKDAIVEWFNGKSIVTIISEKIEEIKQKLKDMKFSDFLDKLKAIKQGLVDFKDKVVELFNTIKANLEANKDVTNSAFQVFEETTGISMDTEMSDLFKGGGLAALGGLIYGLIKMFDGLKDAATNIYAVKDALVETINAITGCFTEMQKSIKAKTVKRIAEAVLMIVVSIALLAILPLEKIAIGIAALSIIGYALYEFVNHLSKMDKKDLKVISQSIILLSAAIFVISMAVKKIGKLGLEGAMAGVLSVIFIMVAMVEVVALLQLINKKIGDADLQETMASLILLAVAVDLMAIAVKAIGKLKPEQAIQGAIAVSVIMALMAAFAASMMVVKQQTGNDMKGIAGYLLGLAVSMVIISAAVAILGKLKPETMGQGLLGLAALLIIIGAFSAAIAASHVNMLRLGAGLLLVALAMNALVLPIAILGKLKPETMGQGILAVIALLGAFTLAAYLLGSTGGTGALALMGIAVAMVVMSAALVTLGIFIVPAIAGIVAITAALLVFIVAGYLLAPVTVVIVALAAAMVLFGTGILLAGVGVAKFGSGALKLATALSILSLMSAEAAANIGTVLAAAIAGIAAGIQTLVIALATGIAEGIAAFLTALAEASDDICKAVVKLGVNIIGVLKALVPLIIDLLGYVIAQVLITTAKYMPDIVQAVMDILIAILIALNNNIYQIVELVGDVLLNIARALIDYIPKLIIISMEGLVQLIQGLIAALDIYGPVFILAYKNFWLVIGKLTLTLIEETFGSLPIIGEKITAACEDAKQNMTEAIADNNEQITAARQSAGEIMEEYTMTLGSEEYKSKAGEGADEVLGGFLTESDNLKPSFAAAGDENAKSYGFTFDNTLKNYGDGIPSNVHDNYVKPLQDIKSDTEKAGQDATDALGDGFLNGMKKYYPDIENSGSDLIGHFGDGFMNGNDSVLPDMENVGADDITAFLDSMKDEGEVNSPSKATEKIGKYMGEGFVNGAKASEKSIESAAKSIAQTAINGIGSKNSEARTSGSYFSAGFANGILGGLGAVSAAAERIGRNALQRLQRALDERSPSKETMQIAKYFDEGFAIGINKYSNMVYSEANSLGEDALYSLKNSMSNFSDVVGSDLENIQPTISPVLNLDNINSGMAGIDSIFSRQQTMRANMEMDNWRSRATTSDMINSTISDMMKRNNENSLVTVNAINELSEKVNKLQIVLDSGELVGGIVEKMDNAFGTRTMYQMRSN